MDTPTTFHPDLLKHTQSWIWHGFKVSYCAKGDEGPAIILLHGFGASWGHWRKTIPALAKIGRVYAIDLLGFGQTAKPAPDSNISYTFETWGQQVADFCQEVVGTPAFLVGNSIGCIVAMQTAVSHPDRVLGVALLNCSLRMLHDRRRAELPWYRSIGAPVLQKLLGIRWVGRSFFKLIAKPNTVRKILLKAYARADAVTDELVELIMSPVSDIGAADVFIAFTRYSQGPLPEELLERLPCPALMIWGADDPWEPIALGQELASFPAVQQFIPLNGVGHCPQDEAPELVNAALQEWILKLTY